MQKFSKFLPYATAVLPALCYRHSNVYLSSVRAERITVGESACGEFVSGWSRTVHVVGDDTHDILVELEQVAQNHLSVVNVDVLLSKHIRRTVVVHLLTQPPPSVRITPDQRLVFYLINREVDYFNRRINTYLVRVTGRRHQTTEGRLAAQHWLKLHTDKMLLNMVKLHQVEDSCCLK